MIISINNMIISCSASISISITVIILLDGVVHGGSRELRELHGAGAVRVELEQGLRSEALFVFILSLLFVFVLFVGL